MYKKIELAIFFLFQLAGTSQQHQCLVTVGNSIFTDCDSVYWSGVTFHFGNVKVTKEMNEICTKGNKEFSVDIMDSNFVKEGSLALILNDKSSHVKPDGKEWWVERISVTCDVSGVSESMTIGIGRPIDSGRLYRFNNFDTMVTSPDQLMDQRVQEITNSRYTHDRTLAFGIGPLVNKQLAREDQVEFQMALLRRKTLRSNMEKARAIKLANLTKDEATFKSLKEIENFWNGSITSFPQPAVVKYWKEDKWFAAQRTQGTDPGNIALVTKIAKTFKVDKDRVKKITGEKLDKLLKSDRLFIADLEILTKFKDLIWAPMALFYLTKDGVLMPLAIQLTREAAAEDVFYPDDPELTWLLAKMYYNTAEAAHHQMVTHLGYTHLLLDQVATTMFRYLSPSHPIFKLLKPHFYEMFGINFYGMYILLDKGGVADLVLTGKRELGLGLLNYGLDIVDYRKINPVLDFQRRQTSSIPVYPYRDRGLDIYAALERYAEGIVSNYYATDDDVEDDWELKGFRRMLSKDLVDRGVGWKNLPGCQHTGKMTKQELVDILTTIIYQATAGHAAINNNEYETYAFVPNYPLNMNKPPPKPKDPIDEEYIVQCLAQKTQAFETARYALLLSFDVGANLGYLEKPLLYSPKDQAIITRFQQDLEELKTKEYPEPPYPYEWLDIDKIRNSCQV